MGLGTCSVASKFWKILNPWSCLVYTDKSGNNSYFVLKYYFYVINTCILFKEKEGNVLVYNSAHFVVSDVWL